MASAQLGSTQCIVVQRAGPHASRQAGKKQGNTHLMVPPKDATLGMTLYASPALRSVTLRTADPRGEVSRETRI
jgi:hypothetical protein